MLKNEVISKIKDINTEYAIITDIDYYGDRSYLIIKVDSVSFNSNNLMCIDKYGGKNVIKYSDIADVESSKFGGWIR